MLPSGNTESTENSPLGPASGKGTLAPTTAKSDESWVRMVKGSSRLLQKSGDVSTLPSGEVCVKIPNKVIEKHKKSWDFFVLGQLYHEPPAQKLLHNVLNGIWSRYHRDISVTKMEGNSFLIRIPNVATRSRVIYQRLWQIQGQTMFVAKWEPGVVPEKPELTAAPIWLELRNVPLQFFNEDGLERIASLVGDPKVLHPDTANKTNLEVAKVLTLIDPRKPLPEMVNAQFENGEVARVGVSSPWMPQVCTHCKEIGHSFRRCKLAPKACSVCQSVAHAPENCPKARNKAPPVQNKKPPAPKAPAKPQQIYVKKSGSVAPPVHESLVKLVLTASISTLEEGECNSPVAAHEPPDPNSNEGLDTATLSSMMEPDSSDISSPEENEDYDDEYGGYTKVLSKRQQKLLRGKGPKNL